MKYRKSDSLWKVILEELFPHFLAFVFPDAHAVYDLARGVEFLDKELSELDPQPNEEKDSRFADKLIKLYNLYGREECFLLHIEVQGETSDKKAFAKRMHQYFYRISDRFPMQSLESLAIFTGKDARQMPKCYNYEHQETKLTFQYPTLSILDVSDEELEYSPNPFAMVIIVAKMRLKEGNTGRGVVENENTGL